MKECLVAVGSNLPNTTLTSIQIIEKVFELIARESAKPAKFSHIYRTPAVPAGSGPDFCNAACLISTNASPCSLLERLHQIEAELERTRSTRWAARSCDLDLIAHGDTILPNAATHAHWANLAPQDRAKEAPDELILPHPRMTERAFVLLPLADIAPHWRHPISGSTVTEMLAALPDKDFEGIEKL